MIARRRGAACILITLLSLPGEAQQPPSVPAVGGPVTPVVRDGQRDFDFEIGTWRTHLKRLVKPLSGSTTWAEYEGTTVVRKVLDGRANLVELRVKGPVGQIEGLSLRLYNSQSRQWSLHFSNIASGALELPTVGEFRNGRGEFYGQDTLNGRVILVRFVISVLSPTSCRFEQAFSVDGGKTWEVNWIATDTRLADAPAGFPALGLPSRRIPAAWGPVEVRPALGWECQQSLQPIRRTFKPGITRFCTFAGNASPRRRRS